MSQENNTSAEKQEEQEIEQPIIPALTYRGRNILCRAQGNSQKKIYKFDDKNDFTIVPETFEDFYTLINVDDIVLANDPMAKDVRGRPNVEKSINEKQRQINIDSALAMEKSDLEATMKKFHSEKVQERMEEFSHAIARGETDDEGKAIKIPEDAEEIANKYADEEVAKKFNSDGKVKVVLPKMAILPGVSA